MSLSRAGLNVSFRDFEVESSVVFSPARQLAQFPLAIESRCNVASLEYARRARARARVHITARFFDLTNARGVQSARGVRRGRRGRGNGRAEWGALRLETIARGSQFAAANNPHQPPSPPSLRPVGYRNFVDSNNGNNDAATAAQRAVNPSPPPPPPPLRPSSNPPLWGIRWFFAPVVHPFAPHAGLCAIAVAAFSPADSTTEQTEHTEMFADERAPVIFT